MRLKFALAIIAALGMLLQGCGRKGPLWLPPSEMSLPTAQAPATQESSAQQPATQAPAAQPAVDQPSQPVN